MSRSMRPLSRRLVSLQCRRYESTTSTEKPKHSRDEVLDFLHAHDDVYLAASKRRIEGMEQQARKMMSMVEQYSNHGGRIQVNPQIPVYQAAFWKQHRQDYKALSERMMKQAERIHLNLTDLETINYPSDTYLDSSSADVATLGKQDRDKMLLQTHGEKESTLWALRNEEAAHRRRFELGLESFEKAVEKFKLDRNKTPMPKEFGRERRPLKENVNRARDESKASDRNKGWGASATNVGAKSASMGNLAKTNNPFGERETTRTIGGEENDVDSARFEPFSSASTKSQKPSEIDTAPKLTAQPESSEQQIGKNESKPETKAKSSPRNLLLDLQRRLEGM